MQLDFKGVKPQLEVHAVSTHVGNLRLLTWKNWLKDSWRRKKVKELVFSGPTFNGQGNEDEAKVHEQTQEEKKKGNESFRCPDSQDKSILREERGLEVCFKW